MIQQLLVLMAHLQLTVCMQGKIVQVVTMNPFQNSAKECTTKLHDTLTHVPAAARRKVAPAFVLVVTAILEASMPYVRDEADQLAAEVTQSFTEYMKELEAAANKIKTKQDDLRYCRSRSTYSKGEVDAGNRHLAYCEHQSQRGAQNNIANHGGEGGGGAKARCRPERGTREAVGVRMDVPRRVSDQDQRRREFSCLVAAAVGQGPLARESRVDVGALPKAPLIPMEKRRVKSARTGPRREPFAPSEANSITASVFGSVPIISKIYHAKAQMLAKRSRRYDDDVKQPKTRRSDTVNSRIAGLLVYIF